MLKEKIWNGSKSWVNLENFEKQLDIEFYPFRIVKRPIFFSTQLTHFDAHFWRVKM